MITYAALAVLAASTLSDHRIRGVTLAVLAMFAVKTWVRRKDVLHPDAESGSE
jgi:heme exporter protein D